MLKFVVHKHRARTLHYDLRIQTGIRLKSFAVPKGIPPKGKKHLAIYTGTRSKAALKFEGEIPEGQYGAGKIKIWDTGNFEILEKTKNKILCDFKGKKLKGKYALVKFAQIGEDKWLFFKHK